MKAPRQKSRATPAATATATVTTIAAADERTMLMVSERAGKDTAGEPVFRADVDNDEERGGVLDHDLDDVARELAPFLAKEWSSTSRAPS